MPRITICLPESMAAQINKIIACGNLSPAEALELVWDVRDRAYRRENDRFNKEFDEWYDKLQKRARSRVAAAIARGDLERPETCPRCGGTGRIEGHHEDYEKPLDVIWLCRKCHSRHHAQEALV